MKKSKQGRLQVALAGRAESGMPMASMLGVGSAPRADAVLAMVLFATAATPHGAAAGRQYASEITKQLLDAAAAGGFTSQTEFMRLVDAGQLTQPLVDLATAIVFFVGGVTKFFELLELVTTPADTMGGAQ